MPESDIVVKGAREHNLRDVNLVLPRNKLICFTGVSGSGKSSLAFDTLYAEGQRRYVQSLSSFARQFLGQMPKPDADYIGGLSPSISISQKSAGTNPRSTVGTITEIYDYLRVLFARVGQGHCPQCQQEITAQTREQIIQRILCLDNGTRFHLLAPVIRGQKGEYRDLFEDFLKQGFVRARVDGQIVSLSDDLKLDRQVRHDIEVVIDRLEIRDSLRPRLAESVEMALKIGKGTILVDVATEAPAEDKRSTRRLSTKRQRATKSARPGDIILSSSYACSECGIGFDPPSPQLFSFNSPQGMCLECDGLGEFYSFDPELLIPNPKKSFKQGCFELIGPWKELGRWRRHIYNGVSLTIERKRGLAEGALLETPWQDLPDNLQSIWLWGTGEEHITFTWRGGNSPMKYGGQFEGIIPDLLTKYRNTASRMQIRQLERYMSSIRCPDCHGQRLNTQARSVRVSTSSPKFAECPARSLPDVCHLSVSDAVDFFSELDLDRTKSVIATDILKEIRGRLGFLTNVGLDYLALDRTAPTLSGGESQRIRLAGQVGCGLVGVLYILDEPSIGLHPRDNDRLLATLAQLRDMGNTVLVVEHDEDTMRAADHIVDFGPGPGVRGGEVVAAGSLPAILKAKKSLTGRFLSGKESIPLPDKTRIPASTKPVVRPVDTSSDTNGGPPEKPSAKKKKKRTAGSHSICPDEPGEHWLTVVGAAQNNLKHIDVSIPLGAFVCVTGASGSGKSSLVNDILVEALRRDLNHGDGDPGKHESIVGLEYLDKLIAIDQSPIGRTPRSNPGTYIKVFDEIRKLYCQLPESKRRGYKPGRFSFNVDGGRCQACDGNGSTRLEMDFLADVWVTCPVCGGHRFNRETLGVKFKNHSIADVLEMDVQQGLELFETIPKIHDKLQTLHDVGLDYLKLGQPSPTLSGGESQRIKLARELVKKSTGRTLYLLDEPTTGLHFADIKMLLKVLHGFVDAGNTVLVVEHNLDVVKTADWIVDLGPDGGVDGGRIVVTGTPAQVADCNESYTGQALAKVLHLENGHVKSSTGNHPISNRSAKSANIMRTLSVRGARQHNLKDVELQIKRGQMTVFSGPSGSGKSSLAMDTIYAEGQRRYVESLSAYARQFVSQMQKPQLEHIEGLSPAIAIEQQNLGSTPRSTVGTSTEIYDYLRILMARLGTPYCPDCNRPVGTQTVDQVVDKVLQEPEGTRLYLMAPTGIEVGQRYETLFEDFRASGYIRVRVDGQTFSLDNPPQIDRRRKHQVEVVIDRIVVRRKSRSRLAESIEVALSVGNGILHVAYPQENTPEPQWKTVVHSQHLACDQCGRSFEPLTPHSFSFNSQLGWCPVCEGLGTQTGANPAALLRDTQFSLAEGAVLLWPNLNKKLSQLMLNALCHGTGIPADVSFDQLDSRQRRIVMHGAGDIWFDVFAPKRKSMPLFRFQFKGLYPALEEAARLSPSFRGRLEHLVDEVECGACGGSRLQESAASAQFRDVTIDQLCRLPLERLRKTVSRWKLNTRERKIAGELLREIRGRVQFLNDVGLGYLTLARTATSLSGGEAQRIRLASQLGSGLCGVLYVLDEPTIGLHPRDNGRLLQALYKLRDLGNTLVLVEHDREVIRGSDSIVDFGPGAGKFGGQVVARGTPDQLGQRRDSVTGPYLSGKKAIPIPSNRRVERDDAKSPTYRRANWLGSQDKATNTKPAKTPIGKKKTKKVPQKKSSARTDDHVQIELQWLEVRGARHNNLRDVSVRFPLGALTAVTGVSGSGKSSLINDCLFAPLAKTLHRANTVPGAHDAVTGMEFVNKVIRVDQQPLGNSPTSNPATYTGLFEFIRMLFAQLPDAKVRGYTPRRFSFNVAGGRCEECEGNGQICVEMHFLPDVWVPCETCHGQRYNPETLVVKYHGQSIADVLNMTCGEAVRLFQNVPKIRRVLQTLCDVGLDYLTLGQSAPTLSGGEAQRVKLAAELSRPDTGRTLYLLDEPTTGLHFDDLVKLLGVLNRLVDLGNTVIVVEHNVDVIKTADWIVDMGPDAGDDGGRVVFSGPPEDVVKYAKSTKIKNNGKRTPRSHTGEALVAVLKDGPYQQRQPHDFEAETQRLTGDLDITEVGRDTKMPWELDGREWHTTDRVGRKGEACRWEGKILAKVVDSIQSLSDFRDTNWNSRTIVEITGQKKRDGWFFHAITGEAWLLKMKFRIGRNTFKRDELQKAIELKTLNELDDIPQYSNEPRIKVKNPFGPWQEVQIQAHTFDEIDSPAFWDFLRRAVDSFQEKTQRMATKPDDIMPWKKLGKKWHTARKGFPPGKRVLWEPRLLEELCRLLDDVANGGQFLWSNQTVVHYFVPNQKEPWATLHTKRPDGLDLVLTGPKNRFALGRVANLGRDREFDGSSPDRDVVKLQFRRIDDLHRGDLTTFLKEHVDQLV